jgi:hypothetical protein
MVTLIIPDHHHHFENDEHWLMLDAFRQELKNIKRDRHISEGKEKNSLSTQGHPIGQ